MSAIRQPVHLQVFVTLTCPYCPRMVHLAHQFAYASDSVRSDMIEGSEFPELVARYGVEGVPRTIINEATPIDGAVAESVLYLAVLRSVDPDEYRRIETSMRDTQGLRKVRAMDEAHTYDVIIVVGGPAAMSAALYAARKGLDIGLIAQKIGGQMTYTAHIDNYLGFPGVSGGELLDRFRFHMESYPLAELLDVRVSAVTREDEVYFVRTETARRFGAHSVIYCAGKEYTRLGVPSEDRFVGHGIAFCATCDAPLYRGKRVAVVGGANSAFTAMRDLLPFADAIHLIHRRDTFTADPALVDQIKGHPKVTLHTPFEVQSFTGRERLTGVKIRPADGGRTKRLRVDGVFLEIGLSPNTQPVTDLISLNKRREVPVSADRSTHQPGFFAAGDVTDVGQKQIAVAVGDGALAALSAHRYLVERGLAIRKPGIDDDWV